MCVCVCVCVSESEIRKYPDAMMLISEAKRQRHRSGQALTHPIPIKAEPQTIQLLPHGLNITVKQREACGMIRGVQELM